MTPKKTHKNKTILIVDDNSLNQDYMCEILSGYDADISIAIDGADAVDSVLHEDNHFDLVFMDIQMPVMDGITATELIRQKYDKDSLPIIAVTANTSQEDKRKCFAAEMNEFASKPVRVKTIRQIISQFSDIKLKEEKSKQTNIANKNNQVNGNGINFGQLLSNLNNNHRAMIKMVSDFFGKYKNISNKLKRQIQDGQFSEAGNQVHTLKGTSGNLALHNIYQLSLELEQYIKDKKSNSALSLLSRLQDEINKLELALYALQKYHPDFKNQNTPDKNTATTTSSKLDLTEIDQLLKSNHLGVLDKFISIKNDLIAATDEKNVGEVEHFIRTLEFRRASEKLHEIAGHLFTS